MSPKPSLIVRWRNTNTDEDMTANVCHSNKRNEHLPHRRHVETLRFEYPISRRSTGRVWSDGQQYGGHDRRCCRHARPLAAVWTQNTIGMYLSVSFIGAMVLSYIVKDRIKEHGKRILGRRLGQWLPDHILKSSKPIRMRRLGAVERISS